VIRSELATDFLGEDAHHDFVNRKRGASSRGRPVSQPLSHVGGSWPGGNSTFYYFFLGLHEFIRQCVESVTNSV
jgi:hypothetical protein